MKTDRSASIFVRISESGKRRYVSAIFDKKGYPKLAVRKGDAEEPHPEGVFAVRYQTPEGVRRWKAVGKDPKLAAAARFEIVVQLSKGIDPITTEQFKPAKALGGLTHPLVAELPTVIARPQTPLAAAMKSWALQTNEGEERALTTAKAYGKAAEYFLMSSKRTEVEAVCKEDIWAYKAWLRQHGHDTRTVYNNMTFLRSFFRAQGVTGLISKRDLPLVEEKVVRSYSDEELRKMRTVAHAEERMLLDFLVGTGFRNGEVMHACYTDIDWSRRLILVQNKPNWKFKVKDRAQREVAVPKSLLDSLAARKRMHQEDALIFPTKTGYPDGHLIRVIKKLHLEAGLSCGKCIREDGKTCLTHPICELSLMHTARKSFATLLSEQGMSLQTICDQLGHEDLETTRKYLASQDLTSERTRSQSDAAFARFTTEVAA